MCGPVITKLRYGIDVDGQLLRRNQVFLYPTTSVPDITSFSLIAAAGSNVEKHVGGQ